ncbi:PDZ domain-containing protein [Lederbergia sp. NSJ-179]|uniref:PDZ domain-containing protein n=1 Tax=Lederbergia sp. NSJ-179 TaxID=2931402 RepID=UPI001FD299BB|nr:PDZ domain-containing protein [Lederbergia sp. NSJ-179]MCJ7840190.1 PDZ domain-containing protein [Lederbergia sp. NSJ-179]
MEWLVEIAKGIGRMMLHPVFYFSMIWVILAGYWRIKRERRDFHVRVHNIFLEFRHLFPVGIMTGMVLSLFSVVLGLTFPFILIVMIAIATILFTFMGNARLLSPAFTIGIPLLLLSLLSIFSIDLKVIHPIDHTDLFGATVMLGLMMGTEGFLMLKNGLKDVSPKLRTSRRGLTVGALQAKRFWLIPAFLFLPSGVMTIPFDWWPVIQAGHESYSLVLLPFLLGFQQQIQTELPEIAVRRIGKQVFTLGLIVLITSVICVFLLPVYAAIITSGFALLGRIWIAYRHRVRENTTPYYFAPRNTGVMVLDVLPHSPADKMGLKTGEIIHTCNKVKVSTHKEMYQALIKNRAYCKLEVFDTNNEIRIVQGALYEGDHHELGILFIEKREGSSPQDNLGPFYKDSQR